MTRDNKIAELAASKLESSGLTVKDAKELGIKTLSSLSTSRLISKAKVPSLQFIYHTLSGKARKDTYRIRFLEKLKGDFGEASSIRYMQPLKSKPAAYLPRTIDWEIVAENTSETVIITEGELKSACAAKYGYACIGLGGVSLWQSKKLGWTLLPELEDINWTQRPVIICFDSDAATNPNIAATSAKLAKTLARRGALVSIASLPDVPGLEKTGIDDLIVHLGPDTFERILSVAEADELTRKLWEFNSRFAFVVNPGFIHDFEEKSQYDPTKFRVSLFANVNAIQASPKADGDVKLKQVCVADEWVKWEQRHQYKGVTYKPGKESSVRGCLNTWPGWGVSASKGSVTPWKNLLDHLFDEASRESRVWFEQWCLYPMANPGSKLLSACGLWSLDQGLGKSLIGKTLGKVYGANYSEISQRELDGDFNGWAVNKQFVMVDDVSAHDSRAKADVLKKIITQDQLQVNVKFMPTYALPDCVNYYLTSNRSNAFYLEDRDRRFFIHEITSEKLSKKFFDEYYEWLDKGGPEALLWHAANKMSFKQFEPYLPPPTTESKEQMTDIAKSEVDRWLDELLENPGDKLRVGATELKRDLFTARELLTLFDVDRQGQSITVTTMGLRAREKLEQLFHGRAIRPERKAERFFVVRRGMKWRKMSTKQAEAHVAKQRAIEQGSSAGKKY